MVGGMHVRPQARAGQNTRYKQYGEFLIKTKQFVVRASTGVASGYLLSFKHHYFSITPSLKCFVREGTTFFRRMTSHFGTKTLQSGPNCGCITVTQRCAQKHCSDFLNFRQNPQSFHKQMRRSSSFFRNITQTELK